MSREQKTEKSAPNIGEKQECRACLCKLDSIDVSYQIFDTWNPPMQGTQATIAEDLAKAANIQLSPNDKHSKLICKCCCDKLQEVCRFTSMVQDNDKILQLRYPNRESETTMWPKPITIDKNILYDNSDVKIKEEVLSEDEYSAAMEVEKGFATVDIKVEPEEILPDKIEIKINGTISLNEYKSENPVTNGDDCEVYEQEEKINKETTESDKSKKPQIKKHSAAYRRLRQKANERKRKYIMNMTPEEKERKRMKDREYYHKRQAQNKTKSIKDMSESEQKRVRELWKKKAQRYKEKKRQRLELESLMKNNCYSANESDSGRGPDTSQDEVDLHSFLAEYQLATLKAAEKLN